MPAVHNPTWNSSQRTAVLIGGVVVLHMAGLWALHSGLLTAAATCAPGASQLGTHTVGLGP